MRVNASFNEGIKSYNPDDNPEGPCVQFELDVALSSEILYE